MPDRAIPFLLICFLAAPGAGYAQTCYNGGTCNLGLGSQTSPALSIGTTTNGLYGTPESNGLGTSLGIVTHCPWSFCIGPVTMTSTGEFVYGGTSPVSPNSANIETNSGPVQPSGVSGVVPIQMNQWSQTSATQPFISWRSRGTGPGVSDIVQIGDILGLWQSSGDDGSLPSVDPNVAAVNVYTMVDGTCGSPGTLNIPGAFVVATFQPPPAAPSGMLDSFKVTCDGNVHILRGKIEIGNAEIDPSGGGHFAGLSNSGATFDTSYTIDRVQSGYEATLSGVSAIDILTNETGAPAENGSIRLPASPGDGQIKTIVCDVETTHLSFVGNGQGVRHPPTRCVEGGSIRLMFSTKLNAWLNLDHEPVEQSKVSTAQSSEPKVVGTIEPVR